MVWLCFVNFCFFVFFCFRFLSLLIIIPLCLGYAYDETGDYRISFYAAGGAMILNSVIITMDHIWIGLDNRRLMNAEQSMNETELKGDTRNIKNEDALDEHAVSNPVMSLYFCEEAKHGVDAFL